MKSLLYVFLLINLPASFAEALEADVSSSPCYPALKAEIAHLKKKESFEKTFYVNETLPEVQGEVHYRVLSSPKSWRGETFYQELMIFDAQTCRYKGTETGSHIGFFNKIVIE